MVVDDVPGMGSLMRARFVEKGVDDGGGGSGSIEGPEMARNRLTFFLVGRRPNGFLGRSILFLVILLDKRVSVG